MNTKRPSYYSAPLKSRAAIVAWLLERADANPRKSYGLFCYNVKLHRLNTDFERAWRNALEGGYLPCTSLRFKEACRALWDNGSSETAFEVGAQDAASNVVDDDGYRMLWDGDRAIAEWDIAGRSGGWLVLKSFDGVSLGEMDRHEFEAFMEPDGASYNWLRNLYRFLVQCDHDFRRPESEVEYIAA